MKKTRILAAAVLIVGSGLALHVALAQQPGIKRTDLQRYDLSAPGREVVQSRVDFAPGAAFPSSLSDFQFRKHWLHWIALMSFRE